MPPDGKFDRNLYPASVHCAGDFTPARAVGPWVPSISTSPGVNWLQVRESNPRRRRLMRPRRIRCYPQFVKERITREGLEPSTVSSADRSTFELPRNLRASVTRTDRTRRVHSYYGYDFPASFRFTASAAHRRSSPLLHPVTSALILRRWGLVRHAGRSSPRLIFNHESMLSFEFRPIS